MNVGVKCQAIYDITTEQVIYNEVLVDSYNGINGALNILDNAHKTNSCAQLDEDIIQDTISKINDLGIADTSYAFNLCDKTIEIPNEAHRIIDIISEIKNNNKVLIELTEDTNFNDAAVIDNIHTLQSAGIPVILDDFGKSNSNVETLMNLKFSMVKIDKDYIQSAMIDKQKLRLFVGIIGLLDNIKVTTVVEGVETIGQYELAKKLGVRAVQGYYVGLPKRDIKPETTEVYSA